MVELSDGQVVEYFHRSYTAVDGLWFLKVEERYGFDVALEIDNEVWRVLPKIQARMLKSLVGMERGKDALLECLKTKLTLEGFQFKVEEGDDGFRIILSECPWHNLMVKSGREELSEKVGSLICNTEYSVWASQFDEEIHFELKTQICKGSKQCILQFNL